MRLLPIGFYVDDERREKIWRRFEDKGAPLTREGLLALFPDEPVLQQDRITSRPG